MSAGQLSGLDSEAAVRAAARSRVYLLFAQALDSPDAAALDEIRGGALADALDELFAVLDPARRAGIDWSGLREAGAGDSLQVEYSRLFDVGASGPPCPLHGGLYGGARMKTMEEAVRFYHHFGLELSQEQRELPDHLRTELEFLHYLAYREAEALQAGADPGPYRRAQRDFLERHPGRWVPELRAKLERERPLRFFTALVGALEALLELARDEVGRAPAA